MVDNKQQTAVEWLIEQVNIDRYKRAFDESEWKFTLKHALEMEKQQLEDAYAYGMGETSQWDSIDKMFNQYYKDTFK